MREESDKLHRHGAGDQLEVIAYLSDARNFGETGKLVRIDTHISHVFLAGEQAVKLKRAVKLDYVDFSTLENRRQACWTELRLNRRTAPEIYLDVRSINRNGNGRIGFSEGEPVDWIVVMRRFDADGLLEAVAERGELTVAMVNQLADIIADFHSKLKPLPVQNGQLKIDGVIAENRSCMIDHVPEIFSEQDVEQLYKRSKKQLVEHALLLDRRARQGYIRHCHGDLHLANICLWKGAPTLFDCLEFNEELATIDTLYDLAFLLMDLWHRKLQVQANELFNRYLDMSNQAEGIAALPLFLSMRAVIRAHVAANQAQLQTSQRKRLALIGKAKAYAATASQFLKPSRPRLIAVGGLSGTGKSTLARAIASDFGTPIGARLLRTDVLRKRLFGVSPETRLDELAYSPEQGERVYALLVEEVETALRCGWTVIADGVFAAEAERQKIADIAERCGTSFVGIWLQAPPEKLLKRVDRRVGDASDADSNVVKRQLDFEIGKLDDWVAVDSGVGPDQVADTVRALVINRASRSQS